LFIGSSKPHVTRNKGHLYLLKTARVIEFPDVSPGTVLLD
jgi:hypothetical protein